MEACVQELFVRVRRVGLMVAGAGSGVLGLVVAWATVQPGVIGSVETAGLVAIFGLLVLPTVVYVAWAVDSKAAVRAKARERTRLAFEAEERARAARDGGMLGHASTAGFTGNIHAGITSGVSSGMTSGVAAAGAAAGAAVVMHASEPRRAPGRRAPARAGAISEA
jgi:hypothetical protein